MTPIRTFLAAALAGAFLTTARADEPKPLKVLLLTGGCCHDYKAQTEILKKGIEERINAVVDQIHVDDGSTKPPLPIYGNPDYAKGYDLVIHDECAADISDPKVIEGVIKPHLDGLPAVALHCAMHSYRQPGFDKKIEKPGESVSMWFELLGLQSTGHGAQKPIELRYTDKNHPITRGFADWTTVNEELYNNVSVFKTAHPLASGKQDNSDNVVVWTNDFGKAKTRVFATTIGHNNQTVADARYLDLIAKGVLWATDKLDTAGKPKAGYGRPGK